MELRLSRHSNCIPNLRDIAFSWHTEFWHVSTAHTHSDINSSADPFILHTLKPCNYECCESSNLKYGTACNCLHGCSPGLMHVNGNRPITLRK